MSSLMLTIPVNVANGGMFIGYIWNCTGEVSHGYPSWIKNWKPKNSLRELSWIEITNIVSVDVRDVYV